MLIQRFITLLFAVPAFNEGMKQPMKEITIFFRSPDDHALTSPHLLQDIYTDNGKDNCAPIFITAKTKNIPPHLQVALINGSNETKI